MRQIVLDTETTGLEVSRGHRLIEIGAVELVNRKLTGNHFHYYLNPEREVDAGALAVHGLNNAFLSDKPKFSEILSEFMAYIEGAELIIHNAAFDLAFLENELRLLNTEVQELKKICRILDTLSLARQLHPGQKNSLDALCKRYKIDNTHRTLHGALLDAQILSRVYLIMTGGQSSLLEAHEEHKNTPSSPMGQEVVLESMLVNDVYPVQKASPEEERAHQVFLELLQKKSGSSCVWQA